jgi:hypothetical protein
MYNIVKELPFIFTYKNTKIAMVELACRAGEMTKYYFHVTDGRSTYKDSNGSTHPSLAGAHIEACRIAAELLATVRNIPAIRFAWSTKEGNELARVPVSLIPK